MNLEYNAKLIVRNLDYMGRAKRICYLSPMRAAKVLASAQSRQNLRCSLIQAVNQEEPSDRKPDPWPLWMAGHARLKFVMTECSKTQIRLAGLILCLLLYCLMYSVNVSVIIVCVMELLQIKFCIFEYSRKATILLVETHDSKTDSFSPKKKKKKKL